MHGEALLIAFSLFSIFHKVSSRRKLNLIKILIEVTLWRMENNEDTMCKVSLCTFLCINWILRGSLHGTLRLPFLGPQYLTVESAYMTQRNRNSRVKKFEIRIFYLVFSNFIGKNIQFCFLFASFFPLVKSTHSKKNNNNNTQHLVCVWDCGTRVRHLLTCVG